MKADYQCLLLEFVCSNCYRLEKCKIEVLVVQSGGCVECLVCVVVGGECSVDRCGSVEWDCRWIGRQW